jgi:hypothetical protein
VGARVSLLKVARGEQIEDEDFHDATSVAVMRLACRPGNATNVVSTACSCL